MYTKEEITANRAELIEALRSGEYSQELGALGVAYEAETTYCVTGLACEISKRGKWVEHPYKPPQLLYEIPGFGMPYYQMPIEVKEHYGFHNARGRIRKEDLADFCDKFNTSDSDAVIWLSDKISNNRPLHPVIFDLMTLNDGHKMPFNLIADMLEEFEEYYFVKDETPVS